jgi:hypothetical protein
VFVSSGKTSAIQSYIFGLLVAALLALNVLMAILSPPSTGPEFKYDLAPLIY